MDPEELYMMGSPYTGPGVGSPESEVLRTAFSQGRRAAVPLTPEELESMKWANWAQSNNFEAQDPRVQQGMVKMYHDNVLPYVASSTGADPSTYQQQFMTNYPTVAQLIGRDLSEVEGRMADAMALGLDEPAATMFSAEGELPEYDRKAAERAGIAADREQLLADVENEFGPDVMTEDQKVAFRLTGDYEMIDPQKAAKASAEVVKQRNVDRGIIDGIDTSIAGIDHAMRQVDQVLDVLGYNTSDTGALEGEGRTAWWELPASGRMSQIIHERIPMAHTDASTLRGYLTTLKASAVFRSLQELRDASVDGSSGLGQVTDREINLLAANIAALDPDNLKGPELAREVHYFASNLARIRDKYERRKRLELAHYRETYGNDFDVDLESAADAQLQATGSFDPVDPTAPVAPAAPKVYEIPPEVANELFGGSQ